MEQVDIEVKDTPEAHLRGPANLLFFVQLRRFQSFYQEKSFIRYLVNRNFLPKFYVLF